MLLVNTPFNMKGFTGCKREFFIALTAKNKIGLIDGSSPKPTPDSELHKAWLRAYNRVVSWLLNSLSREIY